MFAIDKLKSLVNKDYPSNRRLIKEFMSGGYEDECYEDKFIFGENKKEAEVVPFNFIDKRIHTLKSVNDNSGQIELLESIKQTKDISKLRDYINYKI